MLVTFTVVAEDANISSGLSRHGFETAIRDVLETVLPQHSERLKDVLEAIKFHYTRYQVLRDKHTFLQSLITASSSCH